MEVKQTTKITEPGKPLPRSLILYWYEHKYCGIEDVNKLLTYLGVVGICFIAIIIISLQSAITININILFI